jgi:hypothetical protein
MGIATKNPGLTYRTLCRLLAAQEDVALTSALGPDDWRLLATTARREGVAPLLYHTLNEAEMLALAPSGVQADLCQAYYATSARNLLIYRELSRILTALRVSLSPPLTVIFLKGAALAGTVYPNIALRPMSDVDLLIRVLDLPRAQEILLARGYALYPDRAREFDRSFGRAKTFTRQTSFMSVDLHWRLLEWPRGQQAALLTEWLWNSAMERKVADIPALVLSPEAQILHLTSHLAKHRWGRLLWFYDIAQVVRCYENELDWDLILVKAREFEILKALQVTLTRTVELLAPPLPLEVLERLGSERPGLRGKAAFALLTARDKHAAILLSVISRDSLLHKAKYLATVAFPSAEYMTERYQLSDRRKLLLYYVYRLGSWCYFLLRSLLSVLSQGLYRQRR